jgi:hypothetical protein
MKTNTTIAIAFIAVSSALSGGCAGAMQDLHDGQGPRGILGVPLATSLPVGAAISQAGAQIQQQQNFERIERIEANRVRADIIRSTQPQRVDVYLHN